MTESLLPNLDLIKGVVKNFLGNVVCKVDREKQQITIRAKGKEYVLTYEQLAEKLEALFGDG